MFDQAVTDRSGEGQLGDGQFAILQQASERVVFAVLWAHGPLLALSGGNFLQVLLLWGGIATAATLLRRTQPGTPATRAFFGAALCGMPALLVFQWTGQPWQSDAHMLFFAELALTTMLLDRQATIIGAVTIAVYHLVLNLSLPAMVFPDGDDLMRVLLPPAIVIFQCAALVWLIGRTTLAIATAEASAREVARLATRSLAQQDNAQANREREQAALDQHVQSIGEVMSEALGVLGDSISAMDVVGYNLSGAVERTCVSSDAIAKGAEESALNLADVARATEALSANTELIARQLAEASSSAGQSVVQANSTAATVRGLSDAVGQIGDVVRLISDIAGRTNLLALNATIEAARAGDAGKGFAVVAGEVKLLANQTAAATETIRSQISVIRAATGEAVGVVAGVGEAIIGMADATSAIASAIDLQRGTMADVLKNVQTVLHQSNESSHEMREVCKVAELARRASDEVYTVGDEIGRVSGTLRDEVSNLLLSLRSKQGERLRQQRIAGGHLAVSMVTSDGSRVDGKLDNISRSGAAMLCSTQLTVGTEIELRLAGADKGIAASVQRHADGVTGVVFHQDAETIGHADRAIEAVRAAMASIRPSVPVAA